MGIPQKKVPELRVEHIRTTKSKISPHTHSLIKAPAVRSVGWVGVVTSCIWHSTDKRAEWPPFQRCQVYDYPPFFNKKYMTNPIFLGSYVIGPTFLTSRYMRTFSLRDFSRLLVLLVFHELNAIFLYLSNYHQ